MAAPRVAPYVWVTWIARLLAGDAHCAWAAWFRAHHTYDRRPSDFDAAKWASEHTAMVREQSEALQQASYAVSVEDQNAFRLQGQLGVTLGGKPDIVAWRDGEVRVVECKTGQPRHTDTLQVMIYMLVLPHAQPVWRGRTLSGRVHYQSWPRGYSPRSPQQRFQSKVPGDHGASGRRHGPGARAELQRVPLLRHRAARLPRPHRHPAGRRRRRRARSVLRRLLRRLGARASSPQNTTPRVKPAPDLIRGCPRSQGGSRQARGSTNRRPVILPCRMSLTAFGSSERVMTRASRVRWRGFRSVAKRFQISWR